MEALNGTEKLNNYRILTQPQSESSIAVSFTEKKAESIAQQAVVHKKSRQMCFLRSVDRRLGVWLYCDCRHRHLTTVCSLEE